MNNPPDPPEVVEVDTEVVACDGNGGSALGHPRVFLNMEGKGEVDCPYCGRRFVLRVAAASGGAH